MRQTLVLLFISLLLGSCSDERATNPSNDPLNNATAGVKTKITYPTLGSDQILSVEDFEYNSLNKLQKRNSFGGNREILYGYDECYYDGNGLLIKKLNYCNNIHSPSGFLLLISTAYTYSNNLLISERDTFPQASFSEEYKYEYKDGLPLNKLFYHSDSLENKTVYAYKNGRLQNEMVYYKGDNLVYSFDYVYQDNFLVESRECASNGDLSKKISYSYDKSKKLITENVQVLAIASSSTSYVVRYEY
jgi:hypothetical protein